MWYMYIVTSINYNRVGKSTQPVYTAIKWIYTMYAYMYMARSTSHAYNYLWRVHQSIILHNKLYNSPYRLYTCIEQCFVKVCLIDIMRVWLAVSTVQLCSHKFILAAYLVIQVHIHGGSAIIDFDCKWPVRTTIALQFADQSWNISLIKVKYTKQQDVNWRSKLTTYIHALYIKIYNTCTCMW